MPSIFETVTGIAEPPYVAAMDKTKVLDIQIIADEQEWSQMLENNTAAAMSSAASAPIHLCLIITTALPMTYNRRYS